MSVPIAINIYSGENMKKLLLSILFLVLTWGVAATANSKLFTFSGSSEGGAGSATMDIEISDYTLTATIENTSPLLNSDNSPNAPAIVGFGFDFTNDLNLASWSLKALTYNGDNFTPTVLGTNSDTPYWEMGTTLASVTLDYLPQLDGGGINGAIYNPSTAIQDPNNLPNGNNAVFFSTAILTMTFKEKNISLDVYNTDAKSMSPFIRMQRVGIDGEGSLKLPGTPVPEPTTMLLFGTGLVGLAGIVRRKKAQN